MEQLFTKGQDTVLRDYVLLITAGYLAGFNLFNNY